MANFYGYCELEGGGRGGGQRVWASGARVWRQITEPLERIRYRSHYSDRSRRGIQRSIWGRSYLVLIDTGRKGKFDVYVQLDFVVR